MSFTKMKIGFKMPEMRLKVMQSKWQKCSETSITKIKKTKISEQDKPKYSVNRN
jgi:hypothetical protein